MIVRKLADGRLFCINQTSHALMAARHCRAWGNDDFAPPRRWTLYAWPWRSTTTAGTNGRSRPSCGDGVPMDFVHDDDPVGKVALWRRGIDRAAQQHPYAGVLISGHVARLYGTYPGHGLSAAAQEAIQRFVDDHARQVETLRGVGRPACHAALAGAGPSGRQHHAAAILRRGALQVQMPWERRRIFSDVPVDYAGATTDVTMTWDDDTIAFAPWPYRVHDFTVSVHGRVPASDLRRRRRLPAGAGRRARRRHDLAGRRRVTLRPARIRPHTTRSHVPILSVTPNPG
ncbi:MAG: DUF3891 family protein [Caldilineaceae bacterium]